ncbi:Central glycolytic genes regulator [Anoxybacillus sp. BCO1]|nr:Central glycolytic genes regulator [Anoxybacillus sp. BCO1]
MRQWIDVQRKLLPDLLAIMQKRYEILQHIRLMQPIGRRTLSLNLGISERVLRSEVQFLKEQHLLDITAAGMSITAEGNDVLMQLEDMMREVLGLKELEKKNKKEASCRRRHCRCW